MSQQIQLFKGKVNTRFGFESGLDKQAITERVFLSELGLEGDECADPKHHGGSERALHQYPAEHYDYWQLQFPDRGWQAPGMGENLSSRGMTESTVCIGDRYQWGEAIIEVSQPRSPCYKLNKRWNAEGMSEQMQQLSYCGWLYRVVQTGWVSQDDELVLLSRCDDALTVKQVADYFFNDPLNQQGLARIVACETLTEKWRLTAQKRLATNEVEVWDYRLFGELRQTQ
ncbi:sulfurase [Photobacterium jeanii]|uniref:Sulfurase n=1 Tax=Photobacterium jeanii TaxID=858640 RepID=A0A178KAQ1_9GAMM|nr:MOSC domain-containing protein [Photobacterium jeanii]OAN13723.1 sulfurase [Photobacterium jeanii]PST88844.1 MOSC domain-containing protein [Photobacterium jeanii]